MPEENIIEPTIDNIILDNSAAIVTNNQELVLFSTLRAGATPVEPYKLNTSGIDYDVFYEPKCAICNSPLRTLVEHVFIECNKKANSTVKWFAKYYRAKLNWTQITNHMNDHCNLNHIVHPGILDYEDEEEYISKWKYREYDLAIRAIMTEINDVRGIQARVPDAIVKRSVQIEKLTKRLADLTQLRDKNTMGLPNVFQALYELHDMMHCEEDKRIVREKARALKELISS